MWAVVLNTVLALGFLITVLFCIGDVDAVVNTPTGFPIIQILYQSTDSKAGATVIVCMILFSTMIALFGVFASVSRLTWAFARDNGLPFSEFFSRVSLALSIALWRETNRRPLSANRPTRSTQRYISL
jgi:choline transport protein